MLLRLKAFPLLALLLPHGAVAAPAPQSWPLRQFVRWESGWGARTIVADGLRARVEAKHCGVDRPATEGCAERSPYLVATVEAPGMAPVTVTGDPGVAAFVGIGRLTRSAARPALILISDSGGSGSCVTIDVAAPSRASYRHARLDDEARDHGTLCGMGPEQLAWPRTLAGRAAFVLRDSAFQCHFASCAGSWLPPRVLALDGQRTIDVSRDPALAPLYRADMARTRHACEHARDEAQGACAAYAADAARLGLLRQAWRTIRTQVRRGCRVPFTGECPYSNQIPATFPAELAAMLAKAGYR